MGKAFILFFIFCIQISYAELDIDTVREEYRLALSSKEKAEKLLSQLEEENSKNTLMIAYRGSLNAIMCTHITNPAKRLKYVKNAAQFIQQAVDKDPENLEIRFIRFAFELKVPKILGYSKNIQEDKDFLFNHFKKSYFKRIPQQSLQEMIELMKESQEFSEEELATMELELVR